MSRVSLALLPFFFGSCIASGYTPVILISVDTLRADHLSCYKPGTVQTPHIDSLTSGGTLFSQISTPFPLTLPAHTALFTSTYPFSNGVLDNGIPLASSAVTLASVLQKSGYRTAAFIGSFVLDRRFGLDKGFDVYDSPFDVHRKAEIGVGDRKRPGAQVVEAATRWLETNADAPFFLFLHLYDLHAPYDLPAEPGRRHGEAGYAAELVYVDRILGEFLAALDRHGLGQKALIVFTSDHGEGLGEHGESSHGYFIYQSTLHVPLIIHWPNGAKRVTQDRVDAAASLIDLAPTMLDAVGVTRPEQMRGHSLLAPRDAGGAEEVYSESTYARNHFGCATLRCLRSGAYKYIDAPKPELYELSSDPGELKNLYDQQRMKAAALREKMMMLRAKFQASATASGAPVITSETSTALRSLGYLSGSRSRRADSKIDPKDRSADFERYISALALGSSDRASGNILENLRTKLPDVIDIRTTLALSLQRNGENERAAREFKQALELDPFNAPAHFELGSCYFRLGQREDATRQFKAALAIAPWYTRADEALADLSIQNKDYAQARSHLVHILLVDPNSYTAHFNLGILAAMDRNWNEAQQQLTAALHADAGSAEAHKTLGGVYLQRGEQQLAQNEFEEATRLSKREQ